MFVAMGGIALVLFFEGCGAGLGGNRRDLPVDGLADAARDPAAHRVRLRARGIERSRRAWCASSARCSAGCRAASRCWWRRCARCSPRSPAARASRSWRSAACSTRSCAEEGYPEGFSLGLVTASGSLGLLLPPSLPVILYAVVANVPADSLYLAGLVPGLLLIVIVALYGIRVGRKVQTWRQPFSHARDPHLRMGRQMGAVGAAAGDRPIRERARHHRRSGGGRVRLRHRGRVLRRPATSIRCAACPRCCSKPASCAAPCSSCWRARSASRAGWWMRRSRTRCSAAVKTHISSPHGVLAGAQRGAAGAGQRARDLLGDRDPGAAGGADRRRVRHRPRAPRRGLPRQPRSSGFLFPPAGLNLFLASSRFRKPLPELYRHVVPFLIILGIGVLAITYLPQMTTGILRLMGK